MTLTHTTHAYTNNTNNIKPTVVVFNGSKKGIITTTKATNISLHIYRCILNTLRTGDADLRLYAYKQFKYPVPNVLKDSTSHRSYLEAHCTYCWPLLWINYFHHGNQHVNPTILLLRLTKMRYTFITFETCDCTQERTRNNGLAYFTMSIQHKGTHEG
jgi:hypothetical protein